MKQYIPTFDEFLSENHNVGKRYSIYKKEIDWKSHPKKSGSYIAKVGNSELEILSTGYGNWQLVVDKNPVLPTETAKVKSSKDNHTNYNNWANDTVGTLKHTAQEMFESDTNEAEVNELLKVEMAKVEEFVDKLLSKIKNSKLASEIRKFTALQKIDPSSNYAEIVDNIKWKFGREPELRNPEIQRLLATI
jgi:hypothetical protein